MLKIISGIGISYLTFANFINCVYLPGAVRPEGNKFNPLPGVLTR